MTQNSIAISKYLSYALRHGAASEHYSIDTEGFIPVNEIIQKKGFTLNQIRNVVNTNDKQRFFMKEENGQYYIRANQGHTLKTVSDLELKPIVDPNVIPVALHGTNTASWEVIKVKGLSRMERNHIHLASGEYGEEGVISGVRKSARVMIYIDTAKAIADGMKFFLSTNGVILTEGFNGVIPPEFFSKVHISS